MSYLCAVVSDGTLLYTQSGLVWNPATQTTLGTYPLPAIPPVPLPNPVPDDALGLTYFLDTSTRLNDNPAISVDSYNQSTFAAAGSIYFPPFAPGANIATSLALWGSNGFAFFAGGPIINTGQVVLFTTNAIQIPPNPVPAVSSLSPANVTAQGSSFTLSVTGSNFTGGSVVQWNGTALTTTYVSGTQLNAAVPGSDIAQPGTAQVTVLNPLPSGGTSSAVAFTINPTPANANVTPASLMFDSQTVNTTSTAQTVTLGNTGESALTISGIQASGDFSQTNNCSTPVASSTNCTISVTFTPSASGSRQGMLTITDNSANSPQTIALSGTGTAPSFSFSGGSGSNSSQTINSGQTATYNLSVTAASGESGTVNLTCTNAPPYSKCTVNPSSLNLTSGSTANFTVSVATNVSGSTFLLPRRLPRDWPRYFPTIPVGLLWLLALLLLRKLHQQIGRTPAMRLQWASAVAIILIAPFAGCGGGSVTTAPAAVTPAGTYTLDINATQGSVSHTQTITLVVN
jgi:hypothetical protein